jgi:hypothetical protein
MRKHILLPIMLVALLGASAFAHGDKIHVQGIITGVSATSVTVKTANGKSVDVKLVKATNYILHSKTSDQPAQATDLAVGDLVIVHATQGDTGLQADEIRFTVPAKAAPPKSN